MRVSLQPSYILHSRPYRDTSALLEVLTAEFGRVSLVARGSRRPGRKGSGSALLQPFSPLLMSFSGRGELKTLVGSEAASKAFILKGQRMFSGMYLNELLVRLLHRYDAHPQLFAAYARAIEALAGETSLAPVLRNFEFALLDELGYSFDLNVDGYTGEPVREDLWYHYHPNYGMVLRDAPGEGSGSVYAGAELLVMAGGEFGGEVRHSAKRLLRQVMAGHLGSEPLRSRDLFQAGSVRPAGERLTEQSGHGLSGEEP